MPEKKPRDEAGIATALAGLKQVEPPAEPYVLPFPQPMIDEIKAQFSSAVADGIEEGVKRIQEKNEDAAKWAKVAVVASVVTAVGVIALLIATLSKD